jgi:cyclophilin family peptidyl-prolyl cis-trans isomerase
VTAPGWPPPEHPAWQQGPPRWGPPPPHPEPAPGLALTIVISVLFGLFGLIPAALAAGRARRTGHPDSPYWIAFGAGLVAFLALYVGLVLVALPLFVGAVGESTSIDAAAPTVGAAPTADAAAPTTDSPAAESPDGSCTFVPDTSGNPNLIDVGVPAAQVPTDGTAALTMSTTAGPIHLTLDRATAPCASASFVHLAEQRFFDGSRCHREVNLETFGVLQCGDPTGSGSGGPSYRFAEEVTPTTSYPRGTIAMANTGQPASTGSQFFLCFTDTELAPDYTVVGSVDESGLAVLDQIAAAGNDGSFDTSAGGGAPNTPVVITSMTVGR